MEYTCEFDIKAYSDKTADKIFKIKLMNIPPTKIY